jgi:subtilisin family serine protease
VNARRRKGSLSSPRRGSRGPLAALAAGLTLLALSPLLAQELPAVGEIPVTVPDSAPAQRQVLVELTDPPAAVVWAAALADRTVAPEQARRNAAAAARTQLSRVAAAQDSLAARLAGAPFHGREIYRIRRALNAIALFVDAGQVAELRRLPGVRAVHILVPEILQNATSVPFINAPQLWANTLGLPANITGAGVRIGIIDTGIDYQQPMFGGSGLLADYQANDRVTIHAGLFPTAKVVGGTDFAGDAYTGSNLPAPDPNPTDCNGHGSHVAGTAAGFGVNADGTTYTGPYGPATPFSSLRIGPGAAPQALLYALRIFGCKGSTSLTPQAIDWAIDPDGDGDFSDHLDVINMSLGSNYGGISDISAMAAENAALAGVIVVAAAGNAGDTYFIHSSPASATRAIAVAASADPGAGAGGEVVVNSPAGIARAYAAAPDAFGNGAPPPAGQIANVVVVSAGSGVASQGCSALTNAAAVAGNIALVDRGTCSFQTKAATAQAAGAIGVIVVNNVPGDPTLVVMAGDATQPNITIPAVLISSNDGTTIRSQLPGVNATLAAASTGDSITAFTSRGARNVTPPILLKPDVTAPGLNIPSDQSGMTCVTGGGCITPTATGYDAGGQVLTMTRCPPAWCCSTPPPPAARTLPELTAPGAAGSLAASIRSSRSDPNSASDEAPA